MDSMKAPSPTAIAMGALVVIWTEAARRRVSFWVAVRDTMDVMETRRTLVRAQKAHDALDAPTLSPEVEKEPPAEDNLPEETYQRFRRTAAPHPGVRFK